MSSSGTSIHTLTRNDIVRRALRKLGNKNPSNTDIVDGVNTLNDIVKEVDIDGRWLWASTVDETELILNLNQRTYVFSATPGVSNIPGDILDIEQNAMFLLKGTNFVTIRKLSYSERISTFDRENNNEPVSFYLDRQPDPHNSTISFLQTPNATYTARFTYRRRLFDFTAAGDNPDFPQEWNLTLIFKLASELSDEYGLPLQERQLLEVKADKKMKIMKGETSETQTPIPITTEYF